MAPTEPETRRIVLLGKTGSGKSSLANTLFGEKNAFTVNHSVNSGTKFCESQIKNINGRNIQLIDTPGLFDTDPRSTELSPELLKCITECAPGPHAFLLVLKLEKYTVLENAVLALMLKYFSVEALKYTTVVFTRGDDLPEEMKIKEWVKENKDLRNLVQKCGGRCHVFDNKYWNNSEDEYRNNQNQLQGLLRTIDKAVRENRGGYYTNDLLQMVQKEKEKGKGKGSILESVGSYLKKNKTGIMIGALLGAFLGAGIVVVGYCLAAVGGAVVAGATAAGGAVVAGAAAGGATLGAIAGACLSENDDSATERPRETETDLIMKLGKNETVQDVFGAFSKFKSD